MSMLSLPEALKEVNRRLREPLAPTSEVWELANKELKLHLVEKISAAEFTCPVCSSQPGQSCKILSFNRRPHKARITAALTVYGD